MILEVGLTVAAGAGLWKTFVDSRPLVAPPVVAEVVPEPLAEIPFERGEPKSIAEFKSQFHILGLLSDAVNALSPEEMCLEPQMFNGPAGMGKTLLARVVAQELRIRNGVTRFIEAMYVNTEEGLDAIMRLVLENPGAVVFFDEIHVIAKYPHSIKLYMALVELRYLFKGDLEPTKLPPTTFLSATTNPGELEEAFKRRWMPHYFEPYTVEQLYEIVMKRKLPITHDAAVRLLERTYLGGTPWEPLQILKLAHDARRARKAGVIEEQDLKRVFDLYQIDQLGLKLTDRNCIAALFKLKKTKVNGEFKYAGSEENVALMARLDRDEFKTSVRPKLIGRGLLEIRPWWGHTLTDKAIELYGHLKGPA